MKADHSTMYNCECKLVTNSPKRKINVREIAMSHFASQACFHWQT